MGRNPDPTVIVFGFLDHIHDIIYIYDAHFANNQVPAEYAPFIRGKSINNQIRTILPSDAARLGYNELTSAKEELMKLGLPIVEEPFKNPDGSLAIDVGIVTILGRMKLGKLKFAKNSASIEKGIREMEYYHTQRPKSQPWGEPKYCGSDHFIDALRYLVMSIEKHGYTIGNQGAWQDAAANYYVATY